LYVVATDPDSGSVVLGSREECHARSMIVQELNFIGFDPPASGEFRAEVQVRYHHDPAAASITVSEGVAEVVFDQPQLAIAPGQGAAFYRGEDLLGGGWIDSSALVNSAASAPFADELERP
jgi:tRNA-specific 2-thiouridylase